MVLLICPGPRKEIQLYLLLFFSAKATAKLEIYWYIMASGNDLLSHYFHASRKPSGTTVSLAEM